jgi:hypothetical protein
MKHFLETKNYPELYNCYAMWIRNNRQYFTTGSNMVKLPFERVEKPFGFRSFLKTFIDKENEVISVEQDCSEFLNKNPELVKEQADIFSSTFPNIIKTKIEKKEKREQKTHAKLNEFFEQRSISFEEKIVSKLSETAETICALADKGAKHIKTPDGWEIQF